jgi:hypothetical protein
MPADAVEISDGEELGTIKEDKTIAWIGTHLGQARRYRWQVQLNAGEQVAIVGKTEREDSDGSKTWLRIVPPSGEFRWIHRDRVVETAEQLAVTVADAVAADAMAVENDAQNDLVAALSDLVPISRDVSQTGESSPVESGTSILQRADEIPDLRPLPIGSEDDRPRVADRAIQFHRGVKVDDYRDSGAVIGSGLNEQWNDEDDALAESDSSRLIGREDLVELPTSGAVAAASAIAEPLRRMTDVVANFISPPRLVEINSPDANAFRSNASTAADRRWMVGSGRVQNPQMPLLPPATLGESQQAAGSPSPRDVMQTAAIRSASNSIDTADHTPPSRIISVAQITRVEDAVKDADLSTVSQILSRLLAERASADELDPLIRRIDTLLQSGDVNQATRTREILDRAQRYRNLAARRDGPTTIQSTALATSPSPPLKPQLSTLHPIEPEPQVSDSQPESKGWTQSPAGVSLAGATSPNQITTPLGPVSGSATGYLVQVYSSRANSPPFALTNDAGLTIAYITPYPGVNLRNHLNSRIAVSGNEKMLQGMSTPHILVDRVIRR